MTLNDFASEHPNIIKDVRGWCPEGATALCAGLMLCPCMHAYTFGLELLVHAACLLSQGDMVPTAADIATIIETIQPEINSAGELPRDVFVGNIMTARGNRRILTGTWETPDYWVQQALDSLRLAPRSAWVARLWRELQALLDISDAVIQRIGASRYSGGLIFPAEKIVLPSPDELAVAVEAVRIDGALVSGSPLEAFTTTTPMMRGAGSDWLGNSRLERRPLWRTGEGSVILALPTAVSAALRMHLILQTHEAGNLQKFAMGLKFLQENIFYNDLLHNSSRSQDYESQLPRVPDCMRLLMRQAVVEFEPGKVAHVVFQSDMLEGVLEEGLTSFSPAATHQPWSFPFHLARSAGRLRYVLRMRGMTVIIMGGLGRGFALPMALPLPPDWPYCVIHLSDANALHWLEGDWLSGIWKVQEGIAALRAGGLRIETEGECVRALAYWLQKDRVVPLDTAFPAENVTARLDRTFPANLRGEQRQSYDEHASYRPSEKAWFRVAKLYGQAHFAELQRLPAYGSISHARAGVLAGIVQTAKRDWWIEVPSFTAGADRHRVYQVWDACMQWCARLLPCLDSEFELANGNAEIRISGEFDVTDIPRIPTGQLPLVNCSTDAERRVVDVTLHGAFFRALAEPSNRAERELVSGITRAVLGLSADGRDANVAAANRLVAGIIPDENARFMHYFWAQTIRDSLSEIDPGPPLLSRDQDLYTAALGVGAELGFAGEHVITDKGVIQKCLHSAVDILWGRIRERLHFYDRLSFISTVLLNIEAIEAEGAIWRRTSAALRSVYQNQDDILQAAHKQQVARARTALASRVLIEMAVCECPEQGRQSLGRSEYASLLGLSIALIVSAHNSDAVRYGLVEPRLEIWPNGELAVPEDFAESVLQPYQQGHFEVQFERAANAYPKLFKEHKSKPVEEIFDSEFRMAWKVEFGFELEDLLKAEEVVIQQALHGRSRVVKSTLGELMEQLISQGISAGVAQAIIDGLVLRPRDRWDSAPAGYFRRDFEPWEFGRRLSVLRRPLISLDGRMDADGAIIYGAGLVHDAFSLTVGSAFSGSLDQRSFDSVAMKRWIGTIRDRTGHSFNQTICKHMRSLGFEARDSVPMSEFGAGQLGDIDVLSSSKEYKIVLVIECKHLRFARTVGEIGEQLRRFAGEPGDQVHKHLRRVRWLDEHRPLLQKRLRLDGTFELSHLLVTNALVPMAFSRSLPIDNRHISTERDLASAIERIVSDRRSDIGS